MNLLPSLQSLILASLLVSFVLAVLLISGSLFRQSRNRARARVVDQLFKLLDEGELSAPIFHRLARFRKAHYGTLDSALVEVCRTRPSSALEAHTFVNESKRRDVYLKTMHSISRSRRLAAGEALISFGDPSIVDLLLTRAMKLDWTVETYQLILAAVKWADTPNQIRKCWLLLLTYPNLSPRLVAEIVSHTSVRLDFIVQEFINASDRLILAGLEVVNIRSDILDRLKIDWTTLLNSVSVDTLCAAIRVFMRNQRTMPPNVNHWWKFQQARIAFAGEAWRVDTQEALERLFVCLEDLNWWLQYRSAESLYKLGSHDPRVLYKLSASNNHQLVTAVEAAGLLVTDGDVTASCLKLTGCGEQEEGLCLEDELNVGGEGY